MDFTATHAYEASATEVFAAMTTFDDMRTKYEALGQRDIELVRREELDGAVTVVTRRIVPMQLPGFARKVLSPSQTVTQTDRWSAPDADGVRTGTFEVEAKGAPVKVRGTLRLAPTGAQTCTNEMHITVECKVPIVGGKIAELVAKDTRRAVEHEQTWIRQHLA